MILFCLFYLSHFQLLRGVCVFVVKQSLYRFAGLNHDPYSKYMVLQLSF